MSSFRDRFGYFVRKERREVSRLTLILLILLMAHQLLGDVRPASTGRPPVAHVTIPRIERAPQLEEFLQMAPSSYWEGKLAKVEGFIQRAPNDGQPATQHTEAYLGYDDRALYVIYIAHDREPEKIRARMVRRENIATDDDQVGIYLDTFHDRRRAYQFECNPVGIQDDSTYSDDSLDWDESFDTVWDSRGKITSAGYVVIMRIPFKSLRFQPSTSQEWGIALWRYIGRRAEGDWWPYITLQKRGILSQAATADGLANISPGRNLQFIPYFSWRSWHAVDKRDPSQLRYRNDSADTAAGLDAKIVLKDSLVLDLTAKPDFSQVESDDPQSTINQRFETFFPEKRPFFTENASFFEVPDQVDHRLLFTRRIADPDFGARLTGRLGKYSLGVLATDDRSPGESVPVDDPSAGKRAYFDVLRLSRDLPKQSNVGAMFLERRYLNSYNRVFELDGTWKLNKNWTTSSSGSQSWTKAPDGTISTGHDVGISVYRSGRAFNSFLLYLDRSPQFDSQAGFIPRTDIRWINPNASYTFWLKNDWVTKFTPELYLDAAWDFKGTNVFWTFNPTLALELRHQTTIKVWTYQWTDTLRPKDYPTLLQNRTFQEEAYGASLSSKQMRHFAFETYYEWGSWINYFPSHGAAPSPSRYGKGKLEFSILTSRGITLENTYLFDHNRERIQGQAIYNSHILRSKLNWQWNRQLSLRLIAQYNALLANALLTSNPTARGFNTDFLITYLVHPGTAVYVGYNSNLSRPGPPIGGPAPDRFTNDGRQFFVKLSYLFRF